MRIAFLVLTLLVVGFSAEAAAYCRSTTVAPVEPEICSDTGAPLRWFDRCATLTLVPRHKPGLTAEQIRTAVQTSFDHWNDVTCDGEPIGLVAEVSTEPATLPVPGHGRGGNENSIVFIDDEGEWNERLNARDAIALTSTFSGVSSGRIVDSDMEFNDWAFNIGICGDACPPGVTDLENTLTHEAGHFYGLGHMPRGSTATMEIEANPGETDKRVLDPDDIEGICEVYPPGTFPDACTGSAFYPAQASGCGCSTVGAVQPHQTRAFIMWLAAVFVLGMRRVRLRRD